MPRSSRPGGRLLVAATLAMLAEKFNKEHFHVIRDIELILTHPTLDALPEWFRASP
jgi:hypothetical protein